MIYLDYNATTPLCEPARTAMLPFLEGKFGNPSSVHAAGRATRGKHLISAKTEHHAVLNTIEHLEKREGFEVTWLNVSQAGGIDLDQLADTIRDDTVLVSIMYANNETGVIQPLGEISEICRAHGVLLHSDMVQSFGKISAVIPSEVEG